METVSNENGTPHAHVCDCGIEYKWPPYVFAHWNHTLDFECESCKKKIKLLQGKIQEVTK